jgi:hypothetical protein
VIGWVRLWTELVECGRDEWPQLMRVPAWMIEAGGSYSRKQLGSLFDESLANPFDDEQGRNVAIATLEPDGHGNFRVTDLDAGDLDETFASEPGIPAAGVAGGGIEDSRTVVFLDGMKLAPKGKASSRQFRVPKRST